MKPLKSAVIAASILASALASVADAADSAPPQPKLSVPDGFTIELAAGPPLVERPIVAAFDHDGRLYVAESSGSNQPVEKQLAEQPHRIVRLEDVDSDGKYDRRTLFADRMMFPEGAMWMDGALYVSAPPSIWKLTDRDGDGVAEERVEWFQGKTLTHCANDLHGPYAGLDGWIYWCKGAFAEQTHQVNGRPWTTRASHIFRCRPDGSGLEPVMTGGMDNPVDVVFTPEGERLLSATLIQKNGRRDGLLHAIYGGVYGKQHGVLDGHPRTGELMPAMVVLSPTSPCGFERYESDVFGAEYRDNYFACHFNTRSVSRHVLRPAGSTFASTNSDFVTSDNVDFHPTDVLMDADGSLLVLDTGGWYKLCCPTSQLWKPDVLGGIYRVRRVGVEPIDDPHGREIDWAAQSVAQLWELLADGRPAVRRRASEEFAGRRDTAEMEEFLAGLQREGEAPAEPLPGTRRTARRESRPPSSTLAGAWALVRLETEASQALVRQLLSHSDQQVRHAAVHGVSLHRDAAAVPQLLNILRDDEAPVRRVAAEALGRIGDRGAVPHLLAAAAKADDRVLQHSVIYALIELADAAATEAGVRSENPRMVAVALIALDQMPGGGIAAAQVMPLLNSPDDGARHAAQWLASRHPEWGGDLAQWFGEQLRSLQDTPSSAEVRAGPLEEMLTAFAGHRKVQQVLAAVAATPDHSITARQMALRVIAQAKPDRAPPAHLNALAAVVREGNPQLLPTAVAAARPLARSPAAAPTLQSALAAVAANSKHSQELRVSALAAIGANLPALNHSQWELLVAAISPDSSLAVQSAAAEAIANAQLTPAQLAELCDVMQTVSPIELNRLLVAFEQSTDEQLGLRLLASLRDAAALSSLRLDLLRQSLAKYGPAVQEGIGELESLVNADADAQRERVEELLPQIAGGDVRRGHAVYYSSKAACSACHTLGNAGGTVGPELTKIGGIRTERDLLESILFPSVSFVQSYESTLILTIDGKAISGRVIEETDDEYVLATGANEETRVLREDIVEIQPGTVSVMPAGLGEQLSVQELADLIAFLRNAK